MQMVNEHGHSLCTGKCLPAGYASRISEYVQSVFPDLMGAVCWCFDHHGSTPDVPCRFMTLLPLQSKPWSSLSAFACGTRSSHCWRAGHRQCHPWLIWCWSLFLEHFGRRWFPVAEVQSFRAQRLTIGPPCTAGPCCSPVSVGQSADPLTLVPGQHHACEPRWCFLLICSRVRLQTSATALAALVAIAG